MYRILTERKNVDLVMRTLAALGLDYTVYYGDGSWHGQAEPSMTIEFDDVSTDAAERAASMIKRLNRQEAVLLQEITTRSQLV